MKFKFKVAWNKAIIHAHKFYLWCVTLLQTVIQIVIKLYRSCMAKFQENRPAIILTLLFCKNIFLSNLLVIAAIVEIAIWFIDNKSKK